MRGLRAAATAMCVGSAAALTAQVVVRVFLSKFKRTSLIVFALTLAIGTSTLLMSYTGYMQLVSQGMRGFSGVCETGEH